MAVGILELLWHATAEFAAQGDIGRFSNQGIAKLLGWNGNPDRLIEALAETGWLDRCAVHRLLVHDWADHRPDFLRKRLERNKLTIYTVFDPAPDNGGQRRTSLPTVPCLAVPSRVVPSPTKPEREKGAPPPADATERLLSLSFPSGATDKQRTAFLTTLTEAKRQGVPDPFIAHALVSPKAEGVAWKRIDDGIEKAKIIVDKANGLGAKRFLDLQQVVDYAEGEGKDGPVARLAGIRQAREWPKGGVR